MPVSPIPHEGLTVTGYGMLSHELIKVLTKGIRQLLRISMLASTLGTYPAVHMPHFQTMAMRNVEAGIPLITE